MRREAEAYTLTLGEDFDGYFAELHNAVGELHYVSRSFVDPEDAKQAARSWANRYQATISELGHEAPHQSVES